jgi:hypothetical protein
MTSDHGSVVAVHNLDEEPAEATVELTHQPNALFGDTEFEKVDEAEDDGSDSEPWRFEMERYDYCWVRIEEEI